MKLATRIGSALVVIAIGATAAWAQSNGRGAVEITGYYDEKDGEYTKISKNGDTVYQYVQHLKAGDWIGVGIHDGDTLSIGWQKSDGRNLGVSTYRIEAGETGPTLVGEWAPYPGGGTVKDTLQWSRKVD